MMTDGPDGSFFSAAFTAHLRQPPPEILYHYTGQDGLLGIIATSSLWATDIRYMNDATEFRLSLDLFEKRLWNEVYQEYFLTPPYPVRIKRAHVLWMLVKQLAAMEIHATCFCENGDLLSQWRGYAASGYGYALGFRTSALKSLHDGPAYLLGKCIYETPEQVQIVEEAIEYVLDDKQCDEDFAVGEFLGTLTYGAFFKHPSFKEEQEWRLISIPGPTDQRRFRRGKSMILPHTLRDIGVGEKSSVDQVIIGPSPHMDLSERAVQTLLSEVNIKASVRTSSIPFRDW
jgi:Protein of unknown function (DUF2971)